MADTEEEREETSSHGVVEEVVGCDRGTAMKIIARRELNLALGDWAITNKHRMGPKSCSSN